MTTREELVDRHIAEYNARLKHMEELAEKAARLKSQQDLEELSELNQRRLEFAEVLGKLKRNPSQQMLEKAGPMAVWDIVAQRLEQLVEKLTD